METQVNFQQPEALRNRDTIQRLSQQDRMRLESAAQLSPDELICPNCEAIYRVGELACSICGTLFSAGGKTNKLDTREAATLNNTKASPIGPALVSELTPIVFEIQEKHVVLPAAESLIVGRLSAIADSPEPDINLSSFNAKDHGISRQHLRINRHLDIVYVTDLASSNGTYLNGKMLPPHTKRILRSGDELRLGDLVVRVRF